MTRIVIYVDPSIPQLAASVKPLTDLGYSVESVSNALDLLAKVRRSQPDLVIGDLRNTTIDARSILDILTTSSDTKHTRIICTLTEAPADSYPSNVIFCEPTVSAIKTAAITALTKTKLQNSPYIKREHAIVPLSTIPGVNTDIQDLLNKELLSERDKL